MQRSRTEAIRTQIQPSKPKREITNVTNSQNTKRTYGQPSEHIYIPKGVHFRLAKRRVPTTLFASCDKIMSIQALYPSFYLTSYNVFKPKFAIPQHSKILFLIFSLSFSYFGHSLSLSPAFTTIVLSYVTF